MNWKIFCLGEIIEIKKTLRDFSRRVCLQLHFFFFLFVIFWKTFASSVSPFNHQKHTKKNEDTVAKRLKINNKILAKKLKRRQ